MTSNKRGERRKQRRGSLGAAMVEAAASIGYFLLGVLFFMHLAIALYHMSALQHAVATSGRFASLGQTLGNQTRVTSIKQVLASRARGYGMTVSGAQIRVCLANDPVCAQESAGVSGSLVQVSATIPIRIMNQTIFNYSSAVTVVNE